MTFKPTKGDTLGPQQPGKKVNAARTAIKGDTLGPQQPGQARKVGRDTSDGKKPTLNDSSQKEPLQHSDIVGSAAIAIKVLAMAAVEAARNMRSPQPSSSSHTTMNHDSLPVVDQSPLPPPDNSSSHTTMNHDSLPVIEIDNVALSTSKRRGVRDQFVATLQFSYDSAKLSSVKAFRIFRADIGRIQGLNQLSIHGLDALGADVVRSSAKGDGAAVAELAFKLAGVSNSISGLLRIDPISGVRVSSQLGGSSGSIDRDSSHDPRSIADLSSFIDTSKIAKIDQSAAQDLNTLRQLQLQNRSANVKIMNDVVVVGLEKIIDRSVVGRRPSRALSKTNILGGKARLPEFQEISFAAPTKLLRTNTGPYKEFTFVDPTITFGKTYAYYVVAVDSSMRESIRSELGKLDVMMRTVPISPTCFAHVNNGSIAIAITSIGEFTEKFEIYRDNAPAVKDIAGLSGLKGYPVEKVRSVKLDSGFIMIGEALDSPSGGTTFVDRSVMRGRSYTYRVYAVDSFGLKSQVPSICSAHVPEATVKPNSLIASSATFSVDSGNRYINVSLKHSDNRVTSVIITRRDLTLNEAAFRDPSSPSMTRNGSYGTVKKNSAQDPVRHFAAGAWNGVIAITGPTDVFVDKLVAVDHMYQYKIDCLDRFGNLASPVISSPIFISRRPGIEQPTALSATLSQGAEQSVTLSWSAGHVDRSVTDTSVHDDRTFYQVERKPLSGERWEQFPMVTKSALVDPLRNDRAPAFRPSYALVGETYLYRVATFVSGGYVSNFTDPISVFTGAPPDVPGSLHASCHDTKQHPLSVDVTWTGRASSWLVERAVVNNISVAATSPSSPQALALLSYKSVAEIPVESSRGNSAVVDRSNAGDRKYIDNDVVLGNTYFYRVRSTGIDGKVSVWSYTGLVMSNTIFKKKLDMTITDHERKALLESGAALRIGAKK